MTFTLHQIQELLEIINRTHVMFIAKQVGTDILSPADKKLLTDHGIDMNKLPKTGKVSDAFRFGILVDSIKAAKAKSLSYEDFKKFISSGKFIPLTKIEQLALNNVKMQTYSDIKGLGNKISKDFTHIIIEGDRKKRKKFENIIKEEVKEAIIDRKTVSELASALGHKTKDWARDFDRIADYVLHTAYDMGKAEAIKQREGEDGRVYKIVYPEACELCQKAYLTAGIGSKPIVFKLSTLLNNGTNIGRKSKELLPVCGPHHVFCRCELDGVPINSEWDIPTQSWKTVRNTNGVKRKSRAKITINF